MPEIILVGNKVDLDDHYKTVDRQNAEAVSHIKATQNEIRWNIKRKHTQPKEHERQHNCEQRIVNNKHVLNHS